MLILSGDIGGTNTRLQLAEFNGDQQTQVLAQHDYICNDYPSLNDIINGFLATANYKGTDIDSACFAVAGPIVQDEAKFTNLHWLINTKQLITEFGFKQLKLINDFEANGYGIETLSDKDIVTLQKGTAIAHAPKSVIGAGTGLGMALLTWTGEYYQVSPTEGGHVDFAPTTSQQMQLLQYLRKKFHRVSAERIVSGPGIVNIYKFVRDNPRLGEHENPELKFAVASEADPAAAISRFATEHQDHMALRTLDIFIRAYASSAGNLALAALPYGGLYLVGGIAPKLLPYLQSGRFLEVFIDKGRMSHLLQRIPLHVVCNSKVGLQGAAVYAARMV